MRIAIDIRRVNEFGIGTYIWNLVRNLSEVDGQNEYLLVGSDRNFHELGPLRSELHATYLRQIRPGSWREHVSFPLRSPEAQAATSFISRTMIARS